jgi:hypothetical protein
MSLSAHGLEAKLNPGLPWLSTVGSHLSFTDTCHTIPIIETTTHGNHRFLQALQ